MSRVGTTGADSEIGFGLCEDDGWAKSGQQVLSPRSDLVSARTTVVPQTITSREGFVCFCEDELFEAEISRGHSGTRVWSRQGRCDLFL